MPSYLIHKPSCVFIHNPKTGGETLKALLLNGDHQGPVTGPLPKDWDRFFTFGFVRNPFDRLVSAWKMFTQGTEGHDWHLPRDADPEITLAEFLNIVGDDSIELTDDRAANVRIRKHALPQTNPWYGLVTESGVINADFVGRFENFADDVAAIFERLEIPLVELPKRHFTKRAGYQTYFDSQTRNAAEEFYADDLALFGYQFELQPETVETELDPLA